MRREDDGNALRHRLRARAQEEEARAARPRELVARVAAQHPLLRDHGVVPRQDLVDGGVVVGDRDPGVVRRGDGGAAGDV